MSTDVTVTVLSATLPPASRATSTPSRRRPRDDDSVLIPGGVVHELPADLRRALVTNPAARTAWEDITPLARNEFICWITDAKQDTTRQRRILVAQDKLQKGQRRPCCWPGCTHRERTGRP